MVQSQEEVKREQESNIHNQFSAFTEIATTTAIQQDEATQQLLKQIETQSQQTEYKYSNLKKFVIALSVSQAVLLGSIWYLGL